MVFDTNSNKLLQEISTENGYLLLKSHLFLYHAATFQFWLFAALLRIEDLGKRPI